MGDVSQTYADISKINKKIGYEPQTELKEGLNKFTEWHKKYTNS